MYMVRSKLADAGEDEQGFTLPELRVEVKGRAQSLATDVALTNRGG